MHWLPRMENREADAITNNEYHDFDIAKRIEVSIDFIIEQEGLKVTKR